MPEERFALAPAVPAATMPAGRRLAHPRARLRTATHARPARAHARRRDAAHAGAQQQALQQHMLHGFSPRVAAARRAPLRSGPRLHLPRALSRRIGTTSSSRDAHNTYNTHTPTYLTSSLPTTAHNGPAKRPCPRNTGRTHCPHYIPLRQDPAAATSGTRQPTAAAAKLCPPPALALASHHTSACRAQASRPRPDRVPTPRPRPLSPAEHDGNGEMRSGGRKQRPHAMQCSVLCYAMCCTCTCVFGTGSALVRPTQPP
jgi:hypothetical protein